MRKKREPREYIHRETRLLILERDQHRCRYCGASVKGNRYQIDHVYPVSKGGETSIENMVVACPSCNIRKFNSIGIWPNPIYQHGQISRAVRLAENREKRRIASCFQENETPLWMLVFMAAGVTMISAVAFGWAEWDPLYDIGLVLLVVGLYADFSWFLSKYVIFQKVTHKDSQVDIVKLFNRILEWMT